MEDFNDHARVCNICFIPTAQGARNRHFNCFVNIHSLVVFTVVFLGLMGGALMFTRSDNMIEASVAQLLREINYMTTLANADGDINQLQDPKVQEYILNAPAPLRTELVERLVKETGVQRGGVFQCQGRDVVISEEGIWDANVEANMSCAMNGIQQGSRRRLSLSEHLENRLMLAPKHDARRRMQDGLPDAATMDSYKQYSRYAKYGIIALCLLGPVFLLLGMIGLCCSLKYLANHIEGKCESCCGTINGCLTFPLIHAFSLVFATLGIIVIVLIAAILADPHKMLFKVLDMAGGNADLQVLFTELIGLSNAGWDAMQGKMCKEDAVPPSWQIQFVLVPDNPLEDGTIPEKAWCGGWITAYQFSITALILCSACAGFGIFISFYLGYKACCRNKRGNARR